jgi:hypothetical protein
MLLRLIRDLPGSIEYPRGLKASEAYGGASARGGASVAFEPSPATRRTRSCRPRPSAGQSRTSVAWASRSRRRRAARTPLAAGCHARRPGFSARPRFPARTRADRPGDRHRERSRRLPLRPRSSRTDARERRRGQVEEPHERCALGPLEASDALESLVAILAHAERNLSRE